MRQLAHHNRFFKEKKFPVVLILDEVTGPANIGSLFRLADAFNIEKIILCGKETDMNSNRLRRTARSTTQTMSYEQQQSTVETCSRLKAEGYAVIVLEITKNSVPLESLNYRSFQKVALVVGNESLGVAEEVLDMADEKTHILMFGNNSSMNVAQATGIALYEITKTLPAI